MKQLRTTDDSKESRFRKIMALGEAGSGKTTQFATLPGKKFVYIFDPNAIESLPKGIDYVEFIPDITELHVSVQTLKSVEKGFRDSPIEQAEPVCYREFEQDFNERWRDRFFDKYDWVGIDSATTLEEIVMDRTLWVAKKPGKHPEQPENTAAMNTFRHKVRALTAVTNVYMTGHLENRQDDLSKRIFFQPMLIGRNRVRIPLRFSEVIVMYKDEPEAGQGEKYMMQVEKSREFPFIRSTLPRKKKIHGSINVTLDFAKPLEGQGLGRFMR